MQAEPELAEVEKEDYHGIYFSYKEFRSLHTVMAGKNQIGNAAAALEVIVRSGRPDIRSRAMP